jgi:hypothetical protein
VLTLPRRVGSLFSTSPIPLEPTDADVEPAPATEPESASAARRTDMSPLSPFSAVRGRRD